MVTPTDSKTTERKNRRKGNERVLGKKNKQLFPHGKLL